MEAGVQSSTPVSAARLEAQNGSMMKIQTSEVGERQKADPSCAICVNGEIAAHGSRGLCRRHHTWQHQAELIKDAAVQRQACTCRLSMTPPTLAVSVRARLRVAVTFADSVAVPGRSGTSARTSWLTSR